MCVFVYIEASAYLRINMFVHVCMCLAFISLTPTPLPSCSYSYYSPSLLLLLLHLLLPLQLLLLHTTAVPESKDIDLYLDITEPTGWNDTLDQAWRASVDQTQSPTVLMECLLLLEHYINKAWLQVSTRICCTYVMMIYLSEDMSVLFMFDPLNS